MTSTTLGTNTRVPQPCFSKGTRCRGPAEYIGLVYGVSRYISGQFYKRELPGILRLLEQFDETPDEMVIDGYVMLGDRPGLGQYLFESFVGRIPVIGVAKSKHRKSSAIEVLTEGHKTSLCDLCRSRPLHSVGENQVNARGPPGADLAETGRCIGKKGGRPLRPLKRRKSTIDARAFGPKSVPLPHPPSHLKAAPGRKPDRPNSSAQSSGSYGTR